MAFNPLPTFTRTLPRRVPQQPAYQQDPEDERNLLEKLGGGVLSGIGLVGAGLDYFPSMGRDLIGGLTTGDWDKYNPLDQITSPFSFENRRFGRDILTDWGWQRPNQETGIKGWLDDPMEAVRDIGGFAFDVGTDPLTYFAPGLLGAARTASGQVARKADLLKHLPKTLDPGMGKRVGMGQRSLEDLIAAAPDPALARQAAQDAAQGMGKILDDISGPLGRSFGVGLPFMEPSATFGLGKIGRAKDRALDFLGEKARYGKIPGTNFSPGQQFSRLFRAKASELHTPEVGPVGEELFDTKELISRGVREETALKVSELARRGALDDEAAMLGRMDAEGVLDYSKIGPEEAEKARVMREVLESYTTPSGRGDSFPELFASAREIGMRLNDFSDPAGIQYFPRDFVEMLSQSVNRLPREQYLRGLREGTEQFRKVISDPNIVKGSHDDAVRYFWEKYGRDFETRFPQRPIRQQGENILPSTRTAEQAQSLRDRQDLVNQLVHRIRTAYTPEQRAAGGFGRNPILDAQDAKIGMQIGLAKNAAALETIGQFAKPYNLYDEASGAGQTVEEILKRLDVDEVVPEIPRPTLGSAAPGSAPSQGGALVSLARKLGVSTDDAGLDSVRKMIVPERIADDIVRLSKPIKPGDFASPIKKIFDSATNLFKAGVLTWPARYVRDLTSGQIMNMVTGNFSGKAARRMHTLLAGGVDDFTDIPIVNRMLESQGLAKTPENSTEMIRQLMYADEIHTAALGQQGLAETIGEVSEMIPGRTKEFAGEFVGRDPLNPLSPGTFAAGESWLPWQVRGVGERTQSAFKPVATGERIGRYTDSMNRGVAYLTNLQRGASPEQAAKIAKALQVNYAPRTFTQAERSVMKRAFPFYSFASRMIPAITKEILERPGGGLAQMIRAQNLATGDPTLAMPEYLKETSAIPIGEQPDGSERYLGPLGLMHEDPLQFLGGGVRGTLGEVGSRLNPIPKAAIEYAMNRSMFRRGQALDELEPTIGRALANVGLGDTDASGRAKPFIDPLVEHTLANSPLSRFFTTVRTATDKRKRTGDLGPLPLLSNLLTGIRFTDVPPNQQDAIMRDMLTDLAKEDRELGARIYENAYIPKELIAEAEAAGDEDLAERRRLYQAFINRLARRAKERKKAKK